MKYWEMMGAVMLVVAVTAGCGEASQPAPARAAEGYDTQRLVTIGGAVTEIVYALGLGGQVVGTDRSSTYPAGIHDTARLSYFGDIASEGVLSLAPTLVLATDAIGPPSTVAQLRAAGVDVVLVGDAQTMDEAEARIRILGDVLGRETAAARILDAQRAALQEVPPLAVAPAPRALFIYARGAGLINVSGGDTAADLVLELAGLENAVSAFDGFRPLTAEAVVAAAPDVIVIPERGLASLGGADALLRQQGIAQTPAGAARRIIAVDDAMLLGLGPRLGEGVALLARAVGEAYREQ